MNNTNEKKYLDNALMYLFNEGKHYNCYKLLGAHITENENKQKGCLFSVWAPNAKSVSVVCDANAWNAEDGLMQKHEDTGVWEAFVPNALVGQNYKFSITTQKDETNLKADPMAFESQIRPENASVIADISYKWSDKKWLSSRDKTKPYDKPVNIYEMHFGSWKRHEDGSEYSYCEMADELIPYVKKMGYTHIELMPMSEYPFDGSWGYQVTGYYSANSRYGKGKDLKAFIDKCHKENIAVIMDWVPAHFPKDGYALSNFDGTPLYEHPDSRKGEHKEWGTLIFNWERTEVHSFLISNAIFWLDEYHFDGLRVDAVSSMLYLDYNRKDGEWIPNKNGGHENLEAIDFLQKLNSAVFERFPNVMMIAEESTAWPGVTKPVFAGGLGFNFKWNMGWMNDILTYMSMDPYFRGSNHNLLTFSMMYAFAENYILPLSHDEVVHGKHSLIDKMFGSYEQKFAQLRLLYAFMYAHPGKKLLFMGGEFGQFIEWRFAEGLDWCLMDFEMHKKMQKFTAELNKFYSSNKAMYENESDWDGFKWINASDNENSVISFVRISRNKKDKTVVVCNFAAKKYEKYVIGVPSAGEYEVVLNTDDVKFGGKTRKKTYKARTQEYGEFKYTISVNLPELTALYIKKKPRSSIKQN